jgi:membrane-bound lytic murein transglycosylase C
MDSIRLTSTLSLKARAANRPGTAHTIVAQRLMVPFWAVAASFFGCQSFAKSVDRAGAISTGSTVQTITNIAAAKDPKAALKEGLKHRAASYGRSPQALIADIRALKRDYENLTSLLSGNVKRKWGKKEVKLPARTRYVKYTQNYKSRAIVDFDAGEITVETVDEKAPGASLKNAIVTTLLTPDDPRAVDLFSDKPVTLTSDKEPYLLGLVQDDQGKPIATPDQAERFAERLLANRSVSHPVEVQQRSKTALSVKFSMASNLEDKQAEKYRAFVSRYAVQYKISPSLIYAIIRTESNFNPFAVSSVPAYGLMQLVPASGGREAYRHARGQDLTPTRDYLLQAESNIELGAAYLSVLSHEQLDNVSNHVSREYCVISAYNTGPGNVLRSFAKDHVLAFNSINSLEPPGVYERLRVNLPFAETREYLVRVVKFRRRFVGRTNEAAQPLMKEPNTAGAADAESQPDSQDNPEG